MLPAALSTRAGRRALEQAPLARVVAPFAAVLLVAGFSLVPIGGRVGHPLWTHVSASGGSISLDPTATRLEMVKLMGLAALFALSIIVGAGRARAETCLKALSCLGGAYAAWAFLNWTSTPDLILGVVRPYGDGRLSASFLSANSAATLFACQSVLELCLIFRAVRRALAPHWSRRAWSWMKSLGPAPILLFLNASCLVLTASRGGALSAVAAASLATAGFALVGTDDRSAAGGVIAVAGMLAFAGAALLLTSGGVLLGRLADNPIADDRMVVFAAYWRSVLASPWWGYGLGAFHSVNALSMTSASAVSMGTLGAAHNVYLQWLLQSGAAGFVPMMICMGAIVGTILLGLGRRRRQPSIMIFALAVTSVFALHGITDYALEEPSLAAYFTVILGLGYGVATRR